METKDPPIEFKDVLRILEDSLGKIDDLDVELTTSIGRIALSAVGENKKLSRSKDKDRLQGLIYLAIWNVSKLRATQKILGSLCESIQRNKNLGRF
jgi:hypothetical protein